MLLLFHYFLFLIVQYSMSWVDTLCPRACVYKLIELQIAEWFTVRTAIKFIFFANKWSISYLGGKILAHIKTNIYQRVTLIPVMHIEKLGEKNIISIFVLLIEANKIFERKTNFINRFLFFLVFKLFKIYIKA